MTFPGTLLKTHGLMAKKEFGQNFLADPNTSQKIVDKAEISEDDIVLEIGPGLGALTVPAAKRAKKLIAVEKDSRIFEILKAELDLADVKNVELINSDILKVDIEELAIRNLSGGDRIVVIGNLPYNISSQVLFRLVEIRAVVKKAVLMFQKELAQRICSPPGGRDYGRLSAVMQYCSDVRVLTDVGASLFFPKPDVESRVIEVDFYPPGYSLLSTENGTGDMDASFPVPDIPCLTLTLKQERFLFMVIKAAFSKRRKTLKNSLAGSELYLDREKTEKGLAVAGIDPERRAETLDVREFLQLAGALWSLLSEERDSYTGLSDF